jgi:hypothetical protein
VSWDDATTCEYSYDGESYTSASCGLGGGDIPSPPAYGAATLYVQGVDDAGNTGDATVDFEFKADISGCTDPVALNYDSEANIDDDSCEYPDLDPPVLSFNDPTDGATIGTFAASVNWDDAVSCSYAYDSGESVPLTCGDDGSIAAPESAGEHTLTVYGSDDSANEGEASVTFTYSPAPLFADDSGAVTDITENSVIVGYSLATQGSTNVATMDVLYDTDAAYTANGSTYGHLAHFSGPFADSGAMDLHGLACQSDYHFAFVAYNDDYAATSTDATFTTSDCSPAEVAISYPTDGGSLSSWSAVVDWGTSTSCEYALDSGDWQTADCSEGGDDITAPEGEGSHTLAVRGSNAASAEWDEDSVTFTVDTTAPVVSIAAPTEGETLSFADFSAEVDWGDATHCSYSYDDFGNSFTVDCAEAGADISAPPGVGAQTLSVMGEDDAGNDDVAEVSVTVEAFSGAGTTDDPYQIGSCGQLPFVSDELDASYILTSDLDCTDEGNDVMIGGESSYFSGTFDGDGHNITVAISDTDDPAIGLFRATDGATIKNIGLLGEIAGGNMTGGLIGVASSTTILNASSSAIVVGLGELASPPEIGTGGVVGSMVGGSILGSHFDGEALGYIAVGGIAGSISSGTLVSRSSNSGQIFSALGAGGIAGYATDRSQIRNSYSDGAVLMYEPFRDGLPVSGSFGGIAGILLDSTISRSYAAGSVGATDTVYPSGGLVGVSEGENLIIYSFSAAEMIGGGDAGVIGGVLLGTTTLASDAFDVAAAGLSSCRADIDDSTGCTAVDTDGDTSYWKNTAHAPLDHFNATDVWDFTQPGDYPLLRAYLGAEPTESDDPDPDSDSDASSDAGPSLLARGGGGIAGLLGTTGVYKGFGYVAPRPQIIFPDGHIVYLDEPPTSQTTTVTNVGAKSPAYVFTRDLQFGMSGNDVQALQKFLIAHGYQIPAGPTGYFGAQTRSALVAFQKAHGISPVAGYFGPKTRAYIAQMKS